MENSFKVVLVFVLVAMVNGRPLEQTSEDNPLKLIAEAVDFYNGESHSDMVFRLYKEEYDYKVGSKAQKHIIFTIKETVCPKSENQTIENCDYKPDGLEKSCAASKNDQEKKFSVICTTVSVETKKDPESKYMDKLRKLEDDSTDQPEDEASYEDYVITMDDHEKMFLEEEDNEEKRILDEFLALKTENTHDKRLVPETAKRTLPSGRFLGRFLCLECFFEVLPR
ncbi:lutzicidin-like [Dendropsophus ebraccatus]|uniref:lutzicidin-like n=1 Tax=Dendropsophus ebraccatus TaxID=150705 RepID=UPI0038316246